MLRCAVVDDESGAVEILTRYIERTPELELAGAFRDAVEAMAYLAGRRIDLLFLDIDMPNLDGMQMADLVRGRDTQIVFCTAYSEYAVESYEKEAADYLLKPIAYERFLKAVNRVLQLRKDRRTAAGPERPGRADEAKTLFIKSGPRIHQIDPRRILYMEKQGHYILFHTDTGEHLSRMNIGELLDTLPEGKYCRIHRSFVVALDRIDTIEKSAVVIKNRRIPIGESFRREFFERIKYSGN